MKRISVIAVYVLFIIYLLSTLTCSDSERRTGLLGQTSTVIINIGHAADHASVNPSMIDRVLRFFTRDAIAQTAPAAFSSIKVRVAGLDIGLIEKNFSPYGAISLTVPAGNLRQFEVTAYVAPGDPSAAASFRGSAIANLPAGETVSIPVIMSLFETKIIALDFFNQRVAIKNNMHSGWDVITRFEQPMDIDFDSRGRIYIVDQNTETIMRLDDINGTNPVIIANVYQDYVAVDRYFNRTFYYNGFDLYQNNLYGTKESLSKNLITGSYTITSINGMDAAPDGMLYIVGQVNYGGAPYDAIIKYDPDANSGNGDIVGTSISNTIITSRLNNPLDIQVKWPYAYIANNNGADGYKILKVKISGSTFSLVGNYGSQALSGPETPIGSFYGPKHFVSLRNDGLIIMDTMAGYSRLVHINNNLTSGWDTVGGANGSGINQFHFN